MNIVLFESAESARELPLSDPRARHIVEVLRRQEGDTFDVGLLNGPRGQATLVRRGPTGLTLTCRWQPPHPPPPPTALVLGFARPQTARDILRDGTTLGARAIHFVATRRSDANYARSSLWTGDEWKRLVVQGLAQAFDTFVPDVSCGQDLAPMLEHLQRRGFRLIALDVHAAPTHLAELSLDHAATPIALLLGPERGWDDTDRSIFTTFAVERFQLGNRVLRTETAVVAALTLLQAARTRA